MIKCLTITLFVLFMTACQSDVDFEEESAQEDTTSKGLSEVNLSIDPYKNEIVNYSKSKHYERVLSHVDSIQIRVHRISSLLSHEGRATELLISSIGTAYSSTEWRDNKQRFGSFPANTEKFERLLSLIANGNIPREYEHRWEDCWHCETDAVEITMANKTLKFSYDFKEDLDYREDSELIHLIRGLTQ